MLFAALLKRDLVAQCRNERCRQAFHQCFDVADDHGIVIQKTYLHRADEDRYNQIVRGAIDIAREPLNNYIFQASGNLFQKAPIKLLRVQIGVSFRAGNMYKKIRQVCLNQTHQQIQRVILGVYRHNNAEQRRCCVDDGVNQSRNIAILIRIENISFIGKEIGARTRQCLDEEIHAHGIRRFNIRKEILQKRQTAQGRSNKKDADAPIDELIDIHQSIDLLLVISGQNTIQVEHDDLLKAKLRKGKRIQDGGEGAVQAQQLYAQILNKDLAANEAEQNRHNLPDQVDRAVAHGLLYSVHFIPHTGSRIQSSFV